MMEEKRQRAKYVGSLLLARIIFTWGGCDVLVMNTTGMFTVAWFVVIMLIGLLQPAGAHFIGLKLARQ